MTYQMKMNKQTFMKTEFGIEMEKVIRKWDETLEIPDRDRKTEVMKKLVWYQAQWEVYKLALKQFYGKEYFFSRTEEYFGICTEDESDWMIRIDRGEAKDSRCKVIKKNVTDALMKTQKTATIAREYKENFPYQPRKSAIGLVMGRATEIGKITL